MRTFRWHLGLGFLLVATVLAAAEPLQAATTLADDQPLPDAQWCCTDNPDAAWLADVQWAWFMAAAFGGRSGWVLDEPSQTMPTDVVAAIKAGLDVEYVFGRLVLADADVQSLVEIADPAWPVAIGTGRASWTAEEHGSKAAAAGSGIRVGRADLPKMAPDMATLSVMGGGLALGLVVRRRVI